MTISDDDFMSDNDFVESDAESDYAPEEEEERPRKKVGLHAHDPLFTCIDHSSRVFPSNDVDKDDICRSKKGRQTQSTSSTQKDSSQQQKQRGRCNDERGSSKVERH